MAQSISALSVQISKALAEVSDNLIAEVHHLATIRAAVTLERTELERLRKIDIAATALDRLVQDYDSKSRALETEMSARRAAWDAELKARERAEREYDENLKRQRQRETEEYEYKKTIDRKKAQEKYDEEMRTLEKRNRDKQETLEKSWQEREGAIKKHEEEYLRLQQEAGSFPSRLQEETERARDEATHQTKQRFEQQVLLMTKEREADRRLSELQIKTLEESVARQTAQMAALQKQLDEAKQQVQDIAVKAIERHRAQGRCRTSTRSPWNRRRRVRDSRNARETRTERLPTVEPLNPTSTLADVVEVVDEFDVRYRGKHLSRARRHGTAAQRKVLQGANVRLGHER